MNDLVVTQLQQEVVSESLRGTVGGVQNSLNYFLDMVKFVLVILLPHMETFGILIILSFSFVFFASCSFMLHTYRTQMGRTYKEEQREEGSQNSDVNRPLNETKQECDNESPEKLSLANCDV